jgi:hypothetical protein
MLGSHSGRYGLGSSVDYSLYGRAPNCKSSLLADECDGEEDHSGPPAPEDLGVDIPTEVKALIERNAAAEVKALIERNAAVELMELLTKVWQPHFLRAQGESGLRLVSKRIRLAVYTLLSSPFSHTYQGRCERV